jgi:hypothetical protein
VEIRCNQRIGPAEQSAASLFAKAEVAVVRQESGSLLLRSPQALGAYPRCLSEYLLRWARTAPERSFVLERGPDTNWRGVTYGSALKEVLRVAGWLVARGLSAAHPVAILSDNSVEHALLTLAAMHVGIPAMPISSPYSLATRDFAKLKSIIARTTPSAIYVDDPERYSAALSAIRSVHAAALVVGSASRTVPEQALRFDIADPTLRLDHVRRARIGLQFVPQPQHLYVDASIGGVFVHPGGLEEPLAGEWSLRSLQKREQQAVFAFAQRHGDSMMRTYQAATGALELPTAELVSAPPRLARSRAAAEPAPPQNSPNAREQFSEAERLGHIVVRTELEADHAIDFLERLADDDHRNIGFGFDFSEQIQPAVPTQCHVENEQARLALGEVTVQFLPASRGAHCDVVFLEITGDCPPRGRITIGNAHGTLWCRRRTLERRTYQRKSGAHTNPADTAANIGRLSVIRLVSPNAAAAGVGDEAAAFMSSGCESMLSSIWAGSYGPTDWPPESLLPTPFQSS